MKTLLRLILHVTIVVNRRLWKYQVGDDCIIDSAVPRRPLNVLGLRGGRPLSAIHLKTRSELLEVKLRNGFCVKVSRKHLFYDSSLNVREAETLTKKDFLITPLGYSRVVSIKPLPPQFTFDVTVASDDASYFADGVLSHNSVISGIFIMWYCLVNFDKSVACTSATDEKVKELLEKIDTVYDNLPFYMKLGIHIDNVKRKLFDNGCSIRGETATEKSGAGLTVNGVLYCDEFALIDPNILRIFYQTVFPTMSSSQVAKMIITSTARGMNLFYQLYMDALNGKNYFNPIRIDWFDVPGRDEFWREQEIKNIGSVEAFNQEYGNSFSSSSDLLFSSVQQRVLTKNRVHFVSPDFNCVAA